ncbi:MAG: sugar ABC transporter ATP-binding protein [Acidimicrobiales bacterium]
MSSAAAERTLPDRNHSHTPGFLSAVNLHKKFGGVAALRGAHLCVERGEIHSLVGANGSGKSTLLNVLSGQLLPDTGTVHLDGRMVRLGNPVRALAMGIATVTQETTLVPELSVAENVLLGPRKKRRWYGIDWRATHQEVARLLEQLEVDFDTRDTVSHLRPDQQQMVEIARALSIQAKVLVLDEPTSALTEHEVEVLFRLVRSLRGRGMTIIFVSHRMSELFQLADRITILRDGATVDSGHIGAYDVERIVEKMVGRAGRSRRAPSTGQDRARDPLLSVRELCVDSRVRGVTFDLSEGEALGIAGLGGSGRGALLDGIFGSLPRTSGSVRASAVPLSSGNIRQAMANGLAYVPGDRKRLGLVSHMTVAENLSMAITSSAGRLRPVRTARERALVRDAVREFGLVAKDSAQPCSMLSGGNQQKLLMAKWLFTKPKVLLMGEPTRGVDVGAKRDIYEMMLTQKSEGLAMVISSSETEELLLLCDRVLVMFRGEVVADVPRQAADESVITHFAMGGSA